MDNQAVDLRPKVCSTCNKPRTWDTPSCPYCSNQSGKSAADTTKYYCTCLDPYINANGLCTYCGEWERPPVSENFPAVKLSPEDEQCTHTIVFQTPTLGDKTGTCKHCDSRVIYSDTDQKWHTYRYAVAEYPIKGGCVSPPSTNYLIGTCSKHGNEIGLLRECAGCVSEKTAGDNLGKTIGELDWQAERSHPSVKGTVTRNDILAWHRQICEEARDLAVRKNRDYAADADPLRNFRLSSQTAGISMSQCALVYLGENVAKYRSFIENGGRSAVKTEKLIDHIRDSINFNILLYAILIDEGYFVHEQKES